MSFTSTLLQLLQNARPTYAPESIGQTQCFGAYEYAYIYICEVGMFCWQVSEVAIKLGGKMSQWATQMVWCQKAAGARPGHALGNVLLLDLIFIASCLRRCAICTECLRLRLIRTHRTTWPPHLHMAYAPMARAPQPHPTFPPGSARRIQRTQKNTLTPKRVPLIDGISDTRSQECTD